MNGEADQAHERLLRIWQVRRNSSTETIIDQLVNDHRLTVSRQREANGAIYTTNSEDDCDTEVPEIRESVVVPVGLFNNRRGDSLETF